VRGLAGILNTSRRFSCCQAGVVHDDGKLHHRGPNDYGYSVDVVAWFARAHLCNFDLENGWPPIYSEDKTSLHVFIG